MSRPEERWQSRVRNCGGRSAADIDHAGARCSRNFVSGSGKHHGSASGKLASKSDGGRGFGQLEVSRFGNIVGDNRLSGSSSGIKCEDLHEV
jgi:hypothetical protein